MLVLLFRKLLSSIHIQKTKRGICSSPPRLVPSRLPSVLNHCVYPNHKTLNPEASLFFFFRYKRTTIMYIQFVDIYSLGIRESNNDYSIFFKYTCKQEERTVLLQNNRPRSHSSVTGRIFLYISAIKNRTIGRHVASVWMSLNKYSNPIPKIGVMKTLVFSFPSH